MLEAWGGGNHPQRARRGEGVDGRCGGRSFSDCLRSFTKPVDDAYKENSYCPGPSRTPHWNHVLCPKTARFPLGGTPSEPHRQSSCFISSRTGDVPKSKTGAWCVTVSYELRSSTPHVRRNELAGNRIMPSYVAFSDEKARQGTLTCRTSYVVLKFGTRNRRFARCGSLVLTCFSKHSFLYPM